MMLRDCLRATWRKTHRRCGGLDADGFGRALTDSVVRARIVTILDRHAQSIERLP
jgi:hypothetical protein